MVDLERLSQLDVYPNSWKYPTTAQTFKRKCANILLRRMGINQKSDSSSMWGHIQSLENFQCASFQVWESTDEVLHNLLNTASRESIFITNTLLRCCTDSDGSLVIENNDEALYRCIKDMFDEDCDEDCDSFELTSTIDYSDYIDAAKAYDLASKGDYKSALDNLVVLDIANAFSMTLSDIITPEQVLECLEVFLGVFDMSENWSCIVHCYGSKEVYEYSQYREYVPEDIRKTMDMFVEIISCPIDVDKTVANYVFYDHENRTFSVILEMLCSSCEEGFVQYDEDDYNLLWRVAFSTLDTELPKLRDKYGKLAA